MKSVSLDGRPPSIFRSMPMKQPRGTSANLWCSLKNSVAELNQVFLSPSQLIPTWNVSRKPLSKFILTVLYVCTSLMHRADGAYTLLLSSGAPSVLHFLIIQLLSHTDAPHRHLALLLIFYCAVAVQSGAASPVKLVRAEMALKLNNSDARGGIHNVFFLMGLQGKYKHTVKTRRYHKSVWPLVINQCVWLISCVDALHPGTFYTRMN